MTCYVLTLCNLRFDCCFMQITMERLIGAYFYARDW